MSEHNFSNQKSALEDYFLSLLGDEMQDMPATASDNQQIDTHVKTDNAISHDSKTAIAATGLDKAAAEVTSDSLSPANRPSVADMLADVEKLVTSEPIRLTEFAEPAAEINIPMPEVSELPETVVEVEAEVDVVVEEETEVVDVVVAQAQEEVTKTQPAKEIPATPDWAESNFQCLLFKVGGLSLAVPLVKLNGVIPWPEKVVETPNQTDWYLGVLMNHGKKVEVIDTAVMVLPAEHRAQMPAEPADRFSHILLVDNQRWGLACDSIGEVIWLNKNEVKWRSNKTKRPWLLGTVIDHMCAVMDTEAFADMLAKQK
ncbi:MAG: chemotaxis protein CheW [Gammaproteobacteria bacterium]|nr:chemotaxis protein CheW [Gammaproteobacteria bacterium]